jgi:hypothetical protein
VTDTKQIPLTNGGFSLVNAADYDRLMRYKWFRSNKGYALCRRPGRASGEGMHRMLMNPPKGMVPDHINGDRLDNRRCNLRLATPLQSAQNRGRNRISTSLYKGVCWKVQNNKWQARIRVNGKQHHIGLYDTEIEAAKAYNAAAMLNHGPYARLNALPEGPADPSALKRFLIQDAEERWRDADGFIWELIPESAASTEQPVELLETLAMLEHEQWMQWAKTIVTSEAISAERKARWFECFKPYHELTEEQKEHDRVWARKVLKYAERLPMRESVSPEKVNITGEMVRRGAIACSQWRNGKKMPFPIWNGLPTMEQEAYADQSLSCLVAALSDIEDQKSK